jgi:hypothetical protein
MGTMFDTSGDPAESFRGLDVESVAAYGNGRYTNYPAAKREFPNVPVLELDVKGEGIGHGGDFESGDMPASEAGSWAKKRIAAGVHRPVIYFQVSSWEPIMASLRAAGLEREHVRIWTAHYDGRPHLCSSACGYGVTGEADATQWGSADYPSTLPAPYKGHHLDVSETAPSFHAQPNGAPPAS